MDINGGATTLFFLEKNALDKGLPETHKAVLATLLKHDNKMYPGELTKAVRAETEQYKFFGRTPLSEVLSFSIASIASKPR